MEKTILIVDDSRSVSEFLREALEDQGYQVLVARDGMEALAQLFKHDVDLLITEVDMPGLSGIELVKAVRKTRKYQNIPVILLSTSPSPEKEQLSGTGGISAFLVKPFNRKDIQKQVQKLVN